MVVVFKIAVRYLALHHSLARSLAFTPPTTMLASRSLLRLHASVAAPRIAARYSSAEAASPVVINSNPDFPAKQQVRRARECERDSRSPNSPNPTQPTQLALARSLRSVLARRYRCADVGRAPSSPSVTARTRSSTLRTATMSARSSYRSSLLLQLPHRQPTKPFVTL